MRIYLLGFMGSGKTYLGKRLAKKLDCEFIDTDDVVVEMANKTIPEIFSEDGEHVFREYERNALINLSQNFNGVLSLGGGTPCYSDNMGIINKSGQSIYIRMNPKSLVKRLQNIKNSRPLLKSKNNDELHSFISDTLKIRERYYLKADYILKGENAVVDDILQLLNK